ncbi:MAG: hypothetical protein N4A45_06900 [Flavobacteriales bacterium]|jgi:hypothetical protein|nr:hypothetical protein [Flavobacteriales bacterium]
MSKIDDLSFDEYIKNISGYNYFALFELKFREMGTNNKYNTLQGSIFLFKNSELFSDKEFRDGLKDLIDVVNKIEIERCVDYALIDIINYIENKTNNFETSKVNIALKEMEVFEEIEFKEIVKPQLIEYYNFKKWKIPFKVVRVMDDPVEIIEFHEMLNKISPFCMDSFYEVKNLLKSKLKSHDDNKIIKEQNEGELSLKIQKHFGFFNMKCPRKHKQILNDNDFEKLINWTISYYENDCIVPKITEPIKVVNTNKTYVQLAFRYLFKVLHNNRTYPNSLFEFYKKTFAPYSEDKEKNFMAVRNDDEVKKLMHIDY